MDAHTSFPVLKTDAFIVIRLKEYVDDVNMEPCTILTAGLLLHKIRYSISVLIKEITDEQFFQTEIFMVAPNLEDVWELFRLVVDRSLIFSNTDRVRRKALAVVKYFAELLMTSLSNRDIYNTIPVLEKLSAQFDAMGATISLTCGDISFEKTGGKRSALKLRLGVLILQSSRVWRELLDSDPKRLQEAKSVLYWLILHADQNSLSKPHNLSLTKTTFWKQALRYKQAKRKKEQSFTK